MTNHEKIKSMSIEEMAAVIEDIRKFGCYYCDFHYQHEKARIGQCPADTPCCIGYQKWFESEADEEF